MSGTEITTANERILSSMEANKAERNHHHASTGSQSAGRFLRQNHQADNAANSKIPGPRKLLKRHANSLFSVKI